MWKGILMDYKEMCRERMTDLALSIHQLEMIRYADDTLIGFGSTPFKLRGMLEFQKNTMFLNQQLLQFLERKKK